MRRQQHRWAWDDDTSLTGHCICGWTGTARGYDQHIGYNPHKPPTFQWPSWLPWDSPAFRWGLLHPFSLPRPWWTLERYAAWIDEHGTPWDAS